MAKGLKSDGPAVHWQCDLGAMYLSELQILVWDGRLPTAHLGGLMDSTEQDP